MPELFSRQQFIVNSERLDASHVGLIGCGAIGRQAAMYLSAMGLKKITLIDHDIIEPHNVPIQLWNPSDVGRPKVDALAEEYSARSPHETGLIVRKYNGRWSKNMTNTCTALFVCVDSMAARKQIYHETIDDEHTTSVEFLCDARMTGLQMRILAEDGTGQYEETLNYTDEDAVSGSCASEACGFTAGIAAGLLCNEFSLWLRDQPFAPDNLVSLFTHEMTALQPTVAG